MDSSDTELNFAELEPLIERVIRVVARMSRGLKSIRTFARDNDISLTKARLELDSERLEAVKLGKKTMITPEAEAAWKARLPRYRPTETGKCYLTRSKRALVDAGST
jgi:hypothetical protein